MYFFFFFNDTATTEIYTLSLHDALPILTCGEGYHNFHHRFPSDYRNGVAWYQWDPSKWLIGGLNLLNLTRDRKSTRLNSSHSQISYAVFCLKKKNALHQFFLRPFPSCNH